ASFAAGGWSTDLLGSGSTAALVPTPVFSGAQAAKLTTTTQANGEHAYAVQTFSWPASDVVSAQAYVQPQVASLQYYSKVFGLETRGLNSWTTRAGFVVSGSTFGALLTTRDGVLRYQDLGLSYQSGQWYQLSTTVDYRGPNPVLSFAIGGQTVYTLTDTTTGTHTDRPTAFDVGFGPVAWGAANGSVVADAVVIWNPSSPPTPTPSPTVTPTPNATQIAVGAWSSIMSWPLVDVHMALLDTGKVLMWDAWETGGTQSARLWDPATDTFTGVPNAFSQIFCAGQSMLADGRQIVVGGHNGADYGIVDTNIFDPATGAWTRVADMHYPRWYPTVLTLPDGRVLALGGESTPGVWIDIPELYDPAANTWTLLPGAQLSVGEYPPAWVMPDGRVFLVAATDGQSRILDVATQTWSLVGPAPVSGGVTVMYRPGKVLVVGGGDANGNVTAATAVIDLNQPTPTWRTTAPMAYARTQHNLVSLPDGKVMVIGGSNQPSLGSRTGILAAELWDPQTETWTTLPSMTDLRMYHSTAVLLPDGRVLAAGGGRLSPAIDYLTAQLYMPAYLSRGAGPVVTSAPATTTYGGTMTIQTPDAASVTGVAFIRLSSVTHTLNTDQRYIGLSFTAGQGTLSVQSPANAFIAPPGDYMLFLLNANGVPSVGQMVRISA
ncbi:MAG TPA: galactose oxidase-like domain-containing protein, partial [Chloroflexota bacterium]|nr:galactose oxidase-like domain-containing protein [Chloroflexota bacterium]